MKKVIFYLMTILGFIGFLSLYVIVCIVTEEQFSALKYVVMIVGYVSLALFVGGFLPLIIMSNKKENKDVKE